jgi:hypoxanthine phosphoribosyltransferase
MKKHYYTWNDVETAANAILAGLFKDSWKPDYVVGITRGGLPLALLLSQRLDIQMETLKVKLRDKFFGEECESNCWMAEDAFGYVQLEDRSIPEIFSSAVMKKKILIVDDINDTGATFNWIKQDWQKSCLPNDPNWDTVWGKNVRFAAMTENLSSEFGDVDYSWHTINKAEDNVWLVYPWEKESWLKLSTQ